jgi:TonB family protein
MKTEILFVSLILSTLASSALAKAPMISSKEAVKSGISMPRPEYPYTARVKKITGSGVALVEVNSRGEVTNVRMAQSTGSPVLDNAATSAFRRWRFKPGRSFYFRTPISFTISSH